MPKALPYANFIKRMSAAVIESLPIFIIVSLPTSSQADIMPIIFMLMLYCGYIVYSNIINPKASFAKTVLKLNVINHQLCDKLSIFQSIWRLILKLLISIVLPVLAVIIYGNHNGNILYIIFVAWFAILYGDFIFVFFHPQKAALHDILAKTRVIDYQSKI